MGWLCRSRSGEARDLRAGVRTDRCLLNAGDDELVEPDIAEESLPVLPDGLGWSQELSVLARSRVDIFVASPVFMWYCPRLRLFLREVGLDPPCGGAALKLAPQVPVGSLE